MLSPTIEAQIEDLAARYGQPRRVVAQLRGENFSPLNEDDRYGEVCMVVRRRNGTLLTAIKTFYPTNGFRLLTGGIHHGEQVEAALWREIAEETSLETTVAAFLAVIEYQLESRPPNSDGSNFTTFAFLVDEQSGTLANQDPGERLGSFREIAVDELPAMAQALASVENTYSDEIHGSWGDWGRFRAVVHDVVYAALTTSDSGSATA